jgi:hypothetical protein
MKMLRAVRLHPLVAAVAWTLAFPLVPGSGPGAALSAQQTFPDVLVFTHITCAYCADAKVYLADLQRRQPDLRIRIRELTQDFRAAADLEAIARSAGVPNPGVPAWVIGGQVFMVGFGGAATTGRQIEQLLAEMGLPARPEPPPAKPSADTAAQNRAPAQDASQARDTGRAPSPSGAPGVSAERAPAEALPQHTAPGEIGVAADEPGSADRLEHGVEGPTEPAGVRTMDAAATTLSLPLVGDLDAGAMSLAALTGLIAFVDGFNPCSLWVLTFLLGIVIYSGSRGRVFLVGGIFLAVTSSVYGLFIAGMFGTLRYLVYLPWITYLVAALAMVFALVNIKDYFWFQEGVSLTISDKHKPKFFERVRNLMHPGRSLPALVVGTVGLALGITLVELPCTAGLPMVWTGIVASKGVSTEYFWGLLGLYLAVYLLDELIVFGSVVVTMKRSRLEEKHGRILKLIGGMIMLALALTLLVSPDVMHSLSGTLAVFGGAAGVTVLILWLHRRVLPRFGIVIGTEELGAPEG